MNPIVKYNNDLNLLPFPKLRAIQMDMFMAVLSLTRDKKENEPFLKQFFDKNKRKIVIPQKDFINLCRLNDSKMDYKEIFFVIDDLLKKLLNSTISYQKDEKTIYNFVCFEEASIIADEVHITLQSKFYDMVICEKYGFTRFELAEFTDLSGKYTKILYRLLKQYRATGFFLMVWDEFLRVMDVPKSYEMRDIERQILKPAVKELTKERNLFDQARIPFKNLSYKKTKDKSQKGRGGKVTHIEFYFEAEKSENIFKGNINNASIKRGDDFNVILSLRKK